MKIYTRTGDEGDTGLSSGHRISKGHIRVAALGSVDELNATLGLAITKVGDDSIRKMLRAFQQDLFALGVSLSTSSIEDGTNKSSTPLATSLEIEELERHIDDACEETPPLKEFILPGGTEGASVLHLARTVCRRAERTVVRLNRDEAVKPEVLQYLNRLSDLLFALARLENYRAGIPDIPWRKELS